MDTDAVVDPVGRWLASRCVRRDDEDFVTLVTEVFDDPQHRVGDAVDIREEALCDDRDAHTQKVASSAFRQGCHQTDDTRRTGASGTVP